MKTFKTSEVAAIVGVHPNTVRFYESIGFIAAPARLKNGYRVYTRLHIAQMKLARTAMRAEVLQNGLRKKAVEIVKLCAAVELSTAIAAANEYREMIDEEIERAKNAVCAVEKILSDSISDDGKMLTRKQAAAKLGITSDQLRNWELNGLIRVKRSENGYRVYNGSDMERLTIIRTLRCANYSLSAILRLMNRLSDKRSLSVTEILNTPMPDDEIISVCDKLQVSLYQTKADAERILTQLNEMLKIKPSIKTPTFVFKV